MSTNASADQDFTVTVRRVIKAPRNRVYAAWLDPEQRKKWWLGLDRSKPTICVIDARVGGRYRMDMLAEQQRWVMEGEFLELVDGQKIVFTWTCNDPLDEVRDNIVTVLFDEVPGGTQVTVRHEGAPSQRTRNAHERGWTGELEYLAELLEPIGPDCDAIDRP